jgi:hypothetical protein
MSLGMFWKGTSLLYQSRNSIWSVGKYKHAESTAVSLK